MTFVGQLDLADLDPGVWPGPRDGLLSFFCHQSPDHFGVEGAGAARVLHLPAGVAPAEADPPAGLFEDFLLDERAVRPRPELTLPAVGVDLAEVLLPLGFGFDDAPRAEQVRDYIRLTDALADAQGFAGDELAGRPPAHRVLGWPRQVQGDVLVELAPADDATEWELLLRVQADHRLGASFGDGGTLFFGLPAGDVAAGRFDRAQALAQSF